VVEAEQIKGCKRLNPEGKAREAREVLRPLVGVKGKMAER